MTSLRALITCLASFPRQFQRNLVWCAIWFVLSGILSLNYYCVYYGELMNELSGTQPPSTPKAADLRLNIAISEFVHRPWWHNATAGLGLIFGEKGATSPNATVQFVGGSNGMAPTIQVASRTRYAASGTADSPDLAAISSKLDEVEGRLHPPQHLPDAILKILTVLALSFLSFYAFVVAGEATHLWQEKKERDRMSHFQRLPARSDTRPSWSRRAYRRIGKLAAFLWTHPVKLVSIVLLSAPAIPFIVSMQHAYEPAVFAMALAAIFVAAEHYSGLKKTEHELKRRTDQLQRGVELVLDADGWRQWQGDIYRLYRKARQRVDAVYRYSDIDDEWWWCAKHSAPWKRYVEFAEENPESMWSVLCNNETKVQFVFDVPLESLPRLAGAKKPVSERAAFFRFFLGLVWNLVVFDMVADQRKENGRDACYVRVLLTRAPFWMHVVDDTVYQLIDRGAKSTVRELGAGMPEKGRKKALGDWARNNVRAAAQRGGRAEEYVCSVLRYCAFARGGAEQSVLDLELVLTDLGMYEWLEDSKPEFLIDSSMSDDTSPGAGRAGKNHLSVITMNEAKTLCIEIFQAFLVHRFEGGPKWKLSALANGVC